TNHPTRRSVLACPAGLFACSSLLLAVTVGMTTVTTAQALADDYTVIDLGTLPGKAYSWTAGFQSINNRGVVPAYANNTPDPNAFAGDLPFLWNRGNIIPLPTLPGASSTWAVSLNDHNQVIGWSGADGLQPVHAVLWDKGEVIDLGTYGD